MVRWILAFMIALAAGWISFDLLREAYGAGAPLYGRTTNMDKWLDPWPMVVFVVGVAAVLLIGLFAYGRGARKKSVMS